MSCLSLVSNHFGTSMSHIKRSPSMDPFQMKEVLTRNRELQQEQHVNLETLARFAMEFQQWALDQIKSLRQELDNKVEVDMHLQQELEHKIGEVKQLDQLACSQEIKIEQMGFEIDNKVDMIKELQQELEHKIGEVKELQQIACSQAIKIEQMGFEIYNKVDINEVDMVKQLQQELENKIREVKCLQQELENNNGEVKELEQNDNLTVARLQGSWESGFVAGRAIDF